MQAELQNGIITGYNITYQSQTENDNGVVPVGPNDLQANLTGLKEFVKYNISVVAFTAKGDGPPSIIIVVRTDEDGKWRILGLWSESTGRESGNGFGGLVQLSYSTFMRFS